MDNRKDLARRELARRELARREALKNNSFQNIPNNQDNLNIGGNKPNLNSLRDIGGGLAKGSQNIASLLGEGGQKIASLLTGGYAPQVNIREELGLGHNNPVDLGKNISSKNPNRILQGIGQYGLPALAGGASIPGQALFQGLNQSAQADPGNKLAEGALAGGSVLGGGILGKNILKFLPNLMSKLKGELNPESIGKLAHEAYNKADSKVEKLYQNVFDEASKRGIKQIPIDKNIFDLSKKYLPKTDSNKDLINRALNGNFESLRKLQSDLGYRGNKALRSPLDAERSKGSEMLDIRKKINNSISSHFKKNGHDDLDELLNNANLQYKNFKDLYHSRGIPKNIFDKDIKEVPNNILKTFSKNSKPMQKFREAHPEIKKRVDANNFLTKLKNMGIAGAIGGPVTYEGYRYLKPKFNDFSQNQ